ncbi:hypothetical protein ACRTC3_21440, partial [Photobacterium damselae]|uniref:hypothetical protein n=1 Tax=Photobacterium damselae TaxID=38293 RepID=UPI003D7ED7DA
PPKKRLISTGTLDRSDYLEKVLLKEQAWKRHNRRTTRKKHVQKGFFGKAAAGRRARRRSRGRGDVDKRPHKKFCVRYRREART